MKQWAGPFYLFCAFTLAGTSVLSAHYVADKLGVFTITAVSLFFAILFLLPICGRKLIKTLRILTRKDFLFLFVQALFGMFLFRMFLISGLLHTSAGEAGILTGVTPAITAILARAFLKEASDRIKLIGIISTVAGVFFIQGLLAPGVSFSYEHFLGNLLILCAASCESLFNILSRFFVDRSNIIEKPTLHPMIQTSIVSTIAMLLCTIPAAFEQPVLLLSEIGLKEWFALFWYGVFVTALAFICWYAGINRCGAITAAAFSGMMPFTALLLSILLLDEHAGWHQWLGGLLVITGIILIGSSNSSVSTDQKRNNQS